MKSLPFWLRVLAVALLVAAAVPGDVVGADDPALPKEPRFTLSDHKDVAWCVVFSADGKSLLTCGGNRDSRAGEVRRYDLTDGKAGARVSGRGRSRDSLALFRSRRQDLRYRRIRRERPNS